MKWKSLIYCHIAAILLVGSFVWPVTQVFWDWLDLFFFHLLNDPLRDNKFLQVFWALANHRWADWFEDICILGFFFAYVRSATKTSRPRKIAELVFSIFFIGLIIFFVNRVLFREYLHIPRESPTLVIDGAVLLSDEISWMSVKDFSPKCFPADHATTAILFAATFAYYAGRHFGIAASLYALFLCLPRMATGAHWLSDVLVGSGAIAFFLLSWVFCTPLHLWAVNGLERFFLLFSRQKENAGSKI